MKKYVIGLAVLAICVLPMGTAFAGKRTEIRFDDLPLGILPPGQHVIGDFVVQQIGFGDPVEVVDLGDGRRGLADSDTSNGSAAGVSILPVDRSTGLKVWSLTAMNDVGWVKIMGQWQYDYELFYPWESSQETLFPSFAGEDVAFLNIAIFGQSDTQAIVSVEAEVSKAVDPSYLGWTTAGRNKLKVAGFGKDPWSPNGTYETEAGATWEISEPGNLDISGILERKSNRSFLMPLDVVARENLERYCAQRFSKTEENTRFRIATVSGKVVYNASRTKVRIRFTIRGYVSGDFGTRPFSLRIKSTGVPAN